jgi:hypothetical protein
VTLVVTVCGASNLPIAALLPAVSPTSLLVTPTATRRVTIPALIPGHVPITSVLKTVPSLPLRHVRADNLKKIYCIAHANFDFS